MHIALKNALERKHYILLNIIQKYLLSCFSFVVPKDCAEIYKSGKTANGVYTIQPENSEAFGVYCDQKTDGGGWTVFQKRLDGSQDFYLGWEYYENGFGSLDGEFWLGLQKIHRLANQSRNVLRVDLEDFSGASAFAVYNSFAVEDKNANYKLDLGVYSGLSGFYNLWHEIFAY